MRRAIFCVLTLLLVPLPAKAGKICTSNYYEIKGVRTCLESVVEDEIIQECIAASRITLNKQSKKIVETVTQTTDIGTETEEILQAENPDISDPEPQ
jgi:hypothetical protein